MSESWQFFFYANLMVFQGSSVPYFLFMRYHLEIRKRRNEFIILFIIAKNYFSFPAFPSVNNKEYKGFQWGKATVKVSLLFAQITAMKCDLFCKPCLVSFWPSEVLLEG